MTQKVQRFSETQDSTLAAWYSSLLPQALFMHYVERDNKEIKKIRLK